MAQLKPHTSGDPLQQPSEQNKTKTKQNTATQKQNKAKLRRLTQNQKPQHKLKSSQAKLRKTQQSKAKQNNPLLRDEAQTATASLAPHLQVSDGSLNHFPKYFPSEIPRVDLRRHEHLFTRHRTAIATIADPTPLSFSCSALPLWRRVFARLR